MALIDALLPNPAVTHFPSVSTFTVAGYTLPGKWILTGAEKQFGWQIQQAYGLSGAVVFPKGDELIVPKFKGTIWRDSDWVLFKAIRKRLLIKPTFKGGASLAVNALGIDHPELKDFGVLAVVVGKVSTAQDEGGGEWICTIDFIQYRAPIPVDPPPSQIISDITRNPVETAQQSVDIQIQQALIRNAALLGKVPPQ